MGGVFLEASELAGVLLKCIDRAIWNCGMLPIHQLKYGFELCLSICVLTIFSSHAMPCRAILLACTEYMNSIHPVYTRSVVV